jgi:hypothetical protein
LRTSPGSRPRSQDGFGNLDGEEYGEDIGVGLGPIKLAMRVSWGETSEDNELLVPVAYRD